MNQPLLIFISNISKKVKLFRFLPSIISEGVRKMNSKTDVKIMEFASPEAAFRKYADMVYRLAFVRTKNKADSDDILQDVFMRYMKIWKRIESEEHVKAMLLKITVNCSNSLKTSSWFKKTEGLNENIIIIPEYQDGSLLQEVLKLPQKYRTAIHLFYYCGYSVNEIAKIESLNPSTVKTHLSRARAILKNTIKADDL